MIRFLVALAFGAMSAGWLTWTLPNAGHPTTAPVLAGLFSGCVIALFVWLVYPAAVRTEGESS